MSSTDEQALRQTIAKLERLLRRDAMTFERQHQRVVTLEAALCTQVERAEAYRKKARLLEGRLRRLGVEP